jgi:hypothetical protein
MAACLGEACLDDGALVAQPLFRAAERFSEHDQIGAAQIAQRNALEVVPNALIRVEFRGITRQALQVQPPGRAPGAGSP